MAEPTGKAAVEFSWSMVAFTACLVIFRVLVRVPRSRDKTFWQCVKRHLSDIFVILGWLSFLLNTVTTTYLYLGSQFSVEYGLYDPTSSLYLSTSTLKWGYASDVVYLNSLFAVKAAIIATYYEFLPMKPWVSTGLIVLSSVTALAWVVQGVLTAFLCLPVERNWSHDARENCLGNWSQEVIFYFDCIVHPGTDVLIYSFPLPILVPLVWRKSALSRHQKIGLGVGFGCGLLSVGVLFTYVGLVLVSQKGDGPRSENELQYFLYGLEQTFALLAVCMPAAVGGCVRGCRSVVGRLGAQRVALGEDVSAAVELVESKDEEPEVPDTG